MPKKNSKTDADYIKANPQLTYSDLAKTYQCLANTIRKIRLGRPVKHFR